MATEPNRISADGLPTSEVGAWTVEKHQRLERYIDISRAVRNKFIGKAGATFIDPFCGFGRSFVRDTDKEIPGSPVIAAEKAAASNTQFSEIHIADIAPAAVEAACLRVKKICDSVTTETGPADQTVTRIIKKLNPYGLHFAFLDPFKMELPFTIIQQLAALKHMDILIHVSVHDFQRNLDLYVRTESGPLDSFAPGWRDVVDVHQVHAAAIRKGIFDHWLRLIRALDMAPSDGVENVYGNQGQRLYWLVFVSRHKLAGEFWNKIRNVTRQGRLFGF